MITLEDWALIRRLAAEGVPKTRIAERLGISRNTVMNAVNSTSPPKYERMPVAETSFTPFEPRVRALLAEFPDMPATVIAERVGWSGSSSWFRQNVAGLRPEHRRVDPADRLEWAPGDAAQCDLWFPPAKIPIEDGTAVLLPVLVMTAAHSRFMGGEMVPTRQTPDLLLGMWSLIEEFGRVPRRLLWDNEAGIGRRNRLAHGVGEFCGVLATRMHQLRAHDPESKGIVERRNGFLETSFMPGRTFTSPADFNAQFTDWLEGANRRVVRTIKARPIDLVDWGRQRCWRCRRSHRGSAGPTRSDWVATTTCESTRTTTPSTRLRSAVRSPSPQICTAFRFASMGDSLLITLGCGRVT